MAYLQAHGVLAIFHFVPLHISPMGQSMGYRSGQLPVTESISSRLLRLPFYFAIKEKEQEEIVTLIKKFFKP